MSYRGVAHLFASGASAGWFGPSTYDECILENMKGVADRAAAGAIMGVCERKFYETSPASRAAAREAVAAQEALVVARKRKAEIALLPGCSQVVSTKKDEMVECDGSR